MKDTMVRTRGWGGDDDAPIPNDDKDGPLAEEDGPLAKDTTTRGPSSSLLGMDTFPSPSQLYLPSIVPFIAASDYHVIVVSAFPMQF